MHRFIDFANDLYKGCENYCPPLYNDELAIFDREKNPALEFCDYELFIAKRDGKPVGRIAALVNDKANERWGVKNVRFGWMDFIDDKEVQLIGCEAAGRGIDTFETAATVSTGRLGVFHGMKSLFCQNEFGQIAPVYSISAGLDYPGIGPEHAYLNSISRAQYVPVTDEEAVQAFEYTSRIEGIIPAIESAHAIAHAMKIAPGMDKDRILVVTVSGRGDKDCAAVARYRGSSIIE